MRVIVIAADGLGAGWLGPYGNEWVPTPAADALAAGGVVFGHHISHRPDPAGARASWRSARLALSDSRQPPLVDFVEALREARVSARLVRQSRADFAEWSAGWRKVYAVGSGRSWDKPAVKLLERLGGVKRSLVWVETDELLPPWELPGELVATFSDDLFDEATDEPVPPWSDPRPPETVEDDATRDRLLRAFAALAARFDRRLERLVAAADAAWGKHGYTLILTGSCGLPLGERGRVGLDEPSLHEERVHVPLIVRPAGEREPLARHLNALTQCVDLGPTLLDAFGLSPPALPLPHGQSLWPACLGAAAPARTAAVAGCGSARLLRTAEWSFLQPLSDPDPAQLFVRPDDRWEVNDVAQHHPDRADEFTAYLREVEEALASGAAVPPWREGGGSA